MGQRASSNPGDRKALSTENVHPSLLIDFATLLLGARLDKFEVSRLPSSWDELLDWTNDAEKISRSSGATAPWKLTRIEPLVHSRENEESVDSIPSLPPIEQATFFAESVGISTSSALSICGFQSFLTGSFYQQVIIKFEMHDRNGAAAHSHLLSVREFAKYYTLVRRLSDLLALERLQCGAVDALPHESKQTLTECVICCDESSNSILPCNHRICEGCERRWVRKQLVCPFCKTRFQSANEIRNSAWHLPEFSEEDLHSDLVNLFAQIEQFWENCAGDAGGYIGETMSLYAPLGRRIIVTTEDDDFVVFRT